MAKTNQEQKQTLAPPSEYLKTVAGALVTIEEMLQKSEELSRSLQEQVNKANTTRIGLLAQKSLLTEMKRKFELLDNPIRVQLEPTKANIQPLTPIVPV